MTAYSWGLGLCAVLLAAAGIAEYECYLPASLLGGITPTAFGFFAFLALAAAIAFSFKEGERRYRDW